MENEINKDLVKHIIRKAVVYDEENQDNFHFSIKILMNMLDRRGSNLARDKFLKRLFKKMVDENDIIQKKKIQYEIIISILSKEKLSRTPLDINILFHFLTDRYHFFKRLRDDMDNEKLLALIRVINYKNYNSGETLINYGDEGYRFYIVLNGRVGIYKHRMIEKEMSYKEYLQYYHNIKFVEKNELKSKRLEDKNEDYLISKALDNLNANTLHLKKTFFIEEEELIHEMNEGDEIGEIALINKIKTTATVKTLESSDIAYIDKSDYNNVIRLLEEKKFQLKVQNLKKNYVIIT